MKMELDNNLTEPFEQDDLGIRASMEGVEPEAGAQERMLQNIRKKAAALQAAEAPKAEILSLNQASKAEKKTEKAKKSRWKLYVPALIAAGLVVTIGSIYFAVIGIENHWNKAAVPGANDVAYHGEQEVGKSDAAEGYKADGSDAKNGAGPQATGAPQESPMKDPTIREDAEIGPVSDDSPTGQAAVPTEDLQPENTVRPDAIIGWNYWQNGKVEGEGIYLTDSKEWSRLTSVRKALTAASKGMNVAGIIENDDSYDAVILDCDGHVYQLQYLENGQIEMPWDPDTERIFITGTNNLTLLKRTKSNVTWLAEWSLDQTNWYYLWNSDGATQEEVLEVVQKLTKNAQEAAK